MSKLENPQITMDSIEQSIEKSIPDLYWMITTNSTGKLLSYFVSEHCARLCDFAKLKDIAKLVSIRYNIGNFQYAAGHLEATVNIFEEQILLVRQISHGKLLAVMIPKNLKELPSKINTFNSFEDIKFTKEGLAKISSNISEFQKNKKKYYDSLEPMRYVLVAESDQDQSSTEDLNKELSTV